MSTRIRRPRSPPTNDTGLVTALTVFGLALVVMAICAILITVFLAIHIFHDHDSHLKQQVITSASGLNITNDNFGGCQNDVDISLYRLQRTGKFVQLYVQGTCQNTSGGSSLDIDLDMEQFPDRYRCPTGDSSDDAAVMGTGSAVIQGSNVTVNVQIEANSNPDQIDIDFEFSDDVPAGSDVVFSIVASYDVGRC